MNLGRYLTALSPQEGPRKAPFGWERVHEFKGSPVTNR